MTGTTKEPSDSEKIRNLIHTVEAGTVFKSYRHLCKHFEIKPTGGNAKKAVIAELDRCCTLKDKGNKIIIIEVFELSQPKISERFLNSKYYSKCSYLLLTFLAEQYCYEEDDEVYYLTTNRILKIISLCNDNYTKTKLNLAMEDSESTFFISEVRRYLGNFTNKILKSISSNKLLNFNKCYMLIGKNNKHRIATDEETKIINDYYKVILEEYGIKNKQAINLSRHAKEIYSKFEEHLGYKHYISNRFNLTADLANGAEYLRKAANLPDNCGSVVNSLVCNDIYNLVFNGIVNIRKDEPKPFDIQRAINNFTGDSFKKEIDEMIEEMKKEHLSKGTVVPPVKYRWGFNSDDDIVNYRIESLIDTFIRVDGDSGGGI
ncbi:MAG: hypothetical protein EPN17_01415 [Methylobacter sp.]|nr:MAG: hypothetical protein EPN17_01415 [Methylobacter sp.]